MSEIMSIYNNTPSCESRRLILILSSHTSLGFPSGLFKSALSDIKRNGHGLESQKERGDGVMWTGLIWLRIGTGGELL
jgi:hypothetical protein